MEQNEQKVVVEDMDWSNNAFLIGHHFFGTRRFIWEIQAVGKVVFNKGD